MIARPTEAYSFIEKEFKEIKEKLLEFDNLVCNYDGENVYRLRLSLLDKIDKLENFKKGQPTYIKLILDREITYLKRVHRFILDIQCKIYMSNIRVAKDFYLYIDRYLYEYRKIHHLHKQDIQKHFNVRG